MRALVTRPRDDAEALARELESRGFEVLVEPLLEIVPVKNAHVPLEDAQGLLITSANGVRALAAATPRRDLPVWAVGEASAAAARGLGFTKVEAAGGDVAKLAELVGARLDPKAGALVHAAGSHVAGDLAGKLGARGFQVHRAVLYEAQPVTSLSAELDSALGASAIDVALFFSPRTAATFVRLARAAQLDPGCEAVRAYGLSAAVAQALKPLRWLALRVAAQPTQESLLAALDLDTAS